MFLQNGIPKKPQEETSVYHYANLLSDQEKDRLEQKLIYYSDSTSTQIVVDIMTSIGVNDIAMFGAELGQKWGIGQKGVDNGVLILIAKDERTLPLDMELSIC